MSPIAPFYADWLYQNLTKGKENVPDSVHLTQLREPDSSLVDQSLSNSMHLAQNISSLVHSLRKKEKTDSCGESVQLHPPITNFASAKIALTIDCVETSCYITKFVFN